MVRGAAAVGLRRGFATARSATAYAAGNSPWSVERDFAKCFPSGTLLHVVDGHGVALMIGREHGYDSRWYDRSGRPGVPVCDHRGAAGVSSAAVTVWAHRVWMRPAQAAPPEALTRP